MSYKITKDTIYKKGYEVLFMSLYDDYFTNNDKPFAENINTALLLSNVFDLTVGVEYPTMCSSQYWGDEESIKKCSVGIVTIKDYDGVTYSSSAITGTGTVKIGFYPNFNAFGKITAIEWTNSTGITCDVYSENGQLIQENVPNGTITTQSAGLGVLQNFELRFHLTSATLTKFKVTMANREDLRYGATVGISNVTGLQNSLNNKLDIAQGSTYANKDVVTDNSGNIVFSNKITKTSDLTNDGDGTYNFVKTNDSRLTDNRTPLSHSHGSIQNGGTLNDDIQGNNVNKIVVTDGSNNIKTVGTLPLDHTTSITVDDSLSTTRTNPVQNKVITSALNGKSDTGHTHTYASLTSKPSSFTPSSHASSATTYGVGSKDYYGHVKVDTSLSTGSANPVQNQVVTNALNGKASSSHTHTKSQITDFTHTHSISDVTNLQTTLNGKASSSHSHARTTINITSSTDNPRVYLVANPDVGGFSLQFHLNSGTLANGTTTLLSTPPGISDNYKPLNQITQPLWAKDCFIQLNTDLSVTAINLSGSSVSIAAISNTFTYFR